MLSLMLSLVGVASVTGFGVVDSSARRVINDPLPAGYQDWDYSDVRPGAHMFWWLYASTNYDVPREETPLILWLQGGQFHMPFFLSLSAHCSTLNSRPLLYPSLTFILPFVHPQGLVAHLLATGISRRWDLLM